MDASEAVSNILYNTPPPSKQPFKRHILNTLVQNEPGVLSRISGTLAARGFNIDSLVVCATEIRDLSRMCIVLRGQDGVVEQARRQLEDLVPVWAVLDYTQTRVIERELMLVKVSILGPEYFEESQYGLNGGAQSSHQSHQQVPPELLAERRQGSPEQDSNRSPAPQDPSVDAAAAVGAHAQQIASTPLTPTEALRVKSDNMRSVIALTEQFRGRVVDVSSTSVIVEMSAKSSRCDAFLKLVRPFGVLECARSGELPWIRRRHCTALIVIISPTSRRNHGPPSIAHHLVLDRQRRPERGRFGRGGHQLAASWLTRKPACSSWLYDRVLSCTSI